MPKAHDYTIRRWGHDFVFMPSRDDAPARMMGWGLGIEAGDYLILPNKPGTTRYRVLSIEYFADPSDMWSADAVFDPRPAAAAVNR